MRKYLFFVVFLLMAFTISEKRPVHVFMAGDSTMANKSHKATPETGWGQVLQDYFSDSVVVCNYAKNGRSSKSFIDEGLWDTITKQLKPGDYVIVQFGHNDNKPDERRHTDPFTTYSDNLRKFINETRDKGGVPILCTSIVRRKFDDNGKLVNTHGDFLEAVKKMAKEENVTFVDMEKFTHDMVEEMGVEGSKDIYLHIEPGVYPQRPKGKVDNTHLSPFGAYKYARLFVDDLRKQNNPLAKYLMEY